MKKESVVIAGVTVVLVIWQVLLAFQGLDLADTGFHLTAYRYILEAPGSVQYSMSFWLSEITGHLWMQVWPQGGLFWARIGGIVAFTATFLIYFRLLQPVTGQRKALAGLAIASLFILRGGFECLHYDLLSMAGYAVVAWWWVTGLRRGRSLLILLGGIALGVNLFFKLTNMAGLLFFALIPFHGIIHRKPGSDWLKTLLIGFSGFIAGAGMILLLIRALGHWDLYTGNLAFMTEIAADAEASHGLIPLLGDYLSGYFNAVIILALFSGAVWGFVRLTRHTWVGTRNLTYLVVFALLGSATLVLMLFFREAFWSKVRYLLLGLAALHGIRQLTDTRKDHAPRLVAAAGLILLLVAPLGSDSWPAKSLHGMWILVPMALVTPDLKSWFGRVKEDTLVAQEKVIRGGVITLVVVSALVHAWQYTYFDAGSRALKRYTVEHPQLRFIHTSKARARVMNELISEAFPLMDQRYLLGFIEIPMINYLADMEPYLSTSWPKLYYSPDSFTRKLQEALARRDALPAIVRQKQPTNIHPWPEAKPHPDYLDYPGDLSRWPGHGRVMNRFIGDFEYEVVWENEMFQLLLPGVKSPDLTWSPS